MSDLKHSLTPVKVCNKVSFACGCMATFHYAGDLAGSGWRCIPCKLHTENREEVCNSAEFSYQLLSNPQKECSDAKSS